MTYITLEEIGKILKDVVEEDIEWNWRFPKLHIRRYLFW